MKRAWAIALLLCSFSPLLLGETIDGARLTVVNAPIARIRLGISNEWVIALGTNSVAIAAGANVTVTTNVTGTNVIYTIASTGGAGGTPGGTEGAVQVNTGGALWGTNDANQRLGYDITNGNFRVSSSSRNLDIFPNRIVMRELQDFGLGIFNQTNWRISSASPAGSLIPNSSNVVTIGNVTNPISSIHVVSQVNLSAGATYVGPTPTNTLALGVDSYGGRLVPKWWDHNMSHFAVQPALFNSRIARVHPTAGGTLGTIGVGTAQVGGTTVGHTVPDSFLPYMVRLSTAASSNATASCSSLADLAGQGTRWGAAGYFFSAEWTMTNFIAGIVGGGAPRSFVGLTALANPNLTNLVNTTNATGQYIGLYLDSKQSLEMYVSARDSVAEFRTNTGISFVATNLYQFYLYNAPTSRFAGWKLLDLTAQTSANGWFSNNVPTNQMKFTILTKNGTNRENNIMFSYLYLEAPLAP